MRKGFLSYGLTVILVATLVLSGCGGGGSRRGGGGGGGDSGGGGPGDEGAGARIYIAGYYLTETDESVPCIWSGNGSAPVSLPVAGAAEGAINAVTLVSGTLYCAGYYSGSSGIIPCYWRGDELFPLPLPDGASGGEAYAVTVVDGRVYTAGYIQAGGKIPCYWVDGGDPVELLPAGGSYGYAKAIAVVDGTVYIAGYYNNGLTTLPCYWVGENNIPVILTPVTVGLHGRANAMIAADGKLHIGGYYQYSSNETKTACYWRVTPGSGISDQIDLAYPSGYACGEVMAVAVAGGRVYLGGHYYTAKNSDDLHPCLWMAGDPSSPVSLMVPIGPEGLIVGEVNGLAAGSDGTLYAAGFYLDSEWSAIPCYWKGSQSQPVALPLGAVVEGEAKGIAVR